VPGKLIQVREFRGIEGRIRHLLMGLEWKRKWWRRKADKSFGKKVRPVDRNF
jgi:hypothetical protein